MSTTDDTNAARRGSESNDLLGPLVSVEMAAYYDGEYMDHSVVKYRLQAFARAVQAAERERLRAEVESLRKDAERYRWLRQAAAEHAGTLDKVADEAMAAPRRAIVRSAAAMDKEP